MLSVTGFSQYLWVIVLIVISNKCSIAEMASKLKTLHTDVKLCICVKIKGSTLKFLCSYKFRLKPRIIGSILNLKEKKNR